ncbi:MAG: hypothetical protein EBT64_08200 [Gammaproteobacteria bacterium]|nr:hypothetical protein [Gammaproteobacteria bacterium]
MMRRSTPRATPRRRSLRAGTFGLVSVLRAAWLSASLIAMADNSPVPHPKPPVAKTREHRSIWHGESVNDPWFWLREKTNPEVIGYLEAENAYMEASTVEAKAYAALIADQFPSGAKVALFYVNNEFGQVYAEAFKEIAPDFNIELVDEQTIEATDAAPPTAQVNSIASNAPDAILAVPLGAGCATFLGEVANAKAANAGWNPSMFLTATCASSLILGLAGPAADGLYTASNLVDILDPEVAAQPAIAEYIAYMEGLGKGDIITTAIAGWHAAEVTVLTLKAAMESEAGLTRASIINAARAFNQATTFTRPGITLKMNGVEDQFLAESLQVVQYDAETKLFTDIGELITEFES